MRYALINKDNKVENIIIWDGTTEVEFPNDYTVIPATNQHELEFNSNNITIQNNEVPLTNEEIEILKNLLNRANL